MRLIECRGSNIDDLAKENYEFAGWNERCGPALIHKHLIPNVKENDRVIDLCCGYGRASMPLMLAGAKASLVDNCKEAIDFGIQLVQEAKMEDQLEKAWLLDVRDLNKDETGKFKFVLAADAIVHMTKTEGFDFVKRMPEFLDEKGGFIYLNASSKLSASYEQAYKYSKRIEDLDTFEVYCGCSGIGKLEPVSFYLPGELESVLKNCGGKIIEARSVEVNHPGNYSWAIVARF